MATGTGETVAGWAEMGEEREAGAEKSRDVDQEGSGIRGCFKTVGWDKIAKRATAHRSKWWAVARLGRACPTLR